MKRFLITVLQVLIVLIAIITLFFLIRFPMTEGRAQNLDLVNIYTDPFILYGYVVSLAFFVGLYQAFRFLGNIRENKLFTLGSLRRLRLMKNCAIVLSVSTVMAGLYIMKSHHKEDDPAGFLGMCLITTFILTVFAVAMFFWEKKLRRL